MPATYEAIATQTIGSAQASVTFSSIPSTYTDLVLVVAGTNTTSAQSIGVTFNGDTGTNYSRTAVYGDGSSALSIRTANGAALDAVYYGTTQGNGIINIMNYANTTTFKTVILRSNDTTSALNATVGLWRNTAAITSLTLTAATTLAANSTFNLYGIKAA
jgi:hypothetical protein